MGNDFQKEYGLKQKPIRLPGSYSFLKFADHPTDGTSSYLIVKSPHKVGIVASDIVLPIKDIKNLSSDYSVATCKRCKPLCLFKPRSQSEMKLIIIEIIKLGTELGRIFVCDGRLMLWCQQAHNLWFRSPQQIQTGKISDKSKVFWAGLCLVNYLNCAYQKQPSLNKSKKSKPKLEVQNFFNPKDKTQYFYFLTNLQQNLGKSSFWSSVSQGMKNLILIMLAPEYGTRIDLPTLKQLPYFAEEQQLKLYSIAVDALLNFQQKQTIIFMQTLEMVIKTRSLFEDLILTQYLTPVLVSLMQKKPQMILSAVIELPDPPIIDIISCVKKANLKNARLFSVILNKKQRLHKILDEEGYDATMARAAFCSFQCEQLIEKLIRAIPFIMKTIKQQNYKKEIQFQLVHSILENQQIQRRILLLGLKCTITLIRQDLISNVTKLYGLNYNPDNYPDGLEICLHMLQVYRLMISLIEPPQLLNIMMVKLEPFLSKQDITDELFFLAKKCVDLMMKRLIEYRDLGADDEFRVDYDAKYFQLGEMQKPGQEQIIQVLSREVQKSKNPNINWLTNILEKQKPLTQL